MAATAEQIIVDPKQLPPPVTYTARSSVQLASEDRDGLTPMKS